MRRLQIDVEVAKCTECPMFVTQNCADEGTWFECNHQDGPSLDGYERQTTLHGCKMDDVVFPEGCPLKEEGDEHD